MGLGIYGFIDLWGVIVVYEFIDLMGIFMHAFMGLWVHRSSETQLSQYGQASTLMNEQTTPTKQSAKVRRCAEIQLPCCFISKAVFSLPVSGSNK